MLLRTGMRVGEALALRWRDVELSAGLSTAAVARAGEGGEARSVPRARDVLAALKAHPRRLGGDSVLCHENGRDFEDWEVVELVPRQRPRSA